MKFGAHGILAVEASLSNITTALQELGRLYRRGRRLAGKARRHLFPGPELAAWIKASRAAEGVPRFTRGRIRLLDYDLEYVDLLTLCPQWHDLFVKETFQVELGTEAPRVLDCGANVGLASLYFKKRYPRARITAFEADPAIAEVLRGNLRRNGCADVEVVEAAVWTSDGSVQFRREGADSGTIEEFASGLDGARASVASVRLARFLETESVDLLKLDIEGGEEAVLRDARGALERVRVLLMDLHELDAERRLTPKVLDLLDEAGFVWSLADLSPLPWRPPVAPPASPFPGTHLCWSVLVRAWKEPR
jgi:FkbM family methyltransferase